jgi:hypothetical protein
MENPRIENWGIVSLDFNPYQPPEAQAKGLAGTVFGHPEFPDGADITTSAIQGVRTEGDHIFVQTRSREYLLGVVNPAYEEQYPNARQRVVNQLKKV